LGIKYTPVRNFASFCVTLLKGYPTEFFSCVSFDTWIPNTKSSYLRDARNRIGIRWRPKTSNRLRAFGFFDVSSRGGAEEAGHNEIVEIIMLLRQNPTTIHRTLVDQSLSINFSSISKSQPHDKPFATSLVFDSIHRRGTGVNVHREPVRELFMFGIILREGPPPFRKGQQDMTGFPEQSDVTKFGDKRRTGGRTR
jgi:hypothetical protein